MSRISKRKLDSNDRISQLPEEIQHHILNFLEKKDVARSQVLSKEWRSKVQSHPILDFCCSYLYIRGREIRFPRFIEDYMTHVDESIQTKLDAKVMSIQRFSLEINGDWLDRYINRWDAKLDRWMQQLVDAKVKDLSLVITCTQSCPYYMFPSYVFLSETITHLKLKHCKVDHCSNVSLPNLLLLRLEDVPLSQKMITKFVSGCPNLEILKLYSSFDGLVSICVSGLARLTEVDLTPGRYVKEVKIVAPKLRFFSVSHIYCGPYEKIDLLACESTLKVLRISSLNNVTVGELKSRVSKFVGLEELVLDRLRAKSIEIPNKNIWRFDVSNCFKLERIKIDVPNLRVLNYRNNKLPFYSLNSSFFLNDTIDFSISINGHNKHMFQSYSNSFRELFLNVKTGRCRDVKLFVKFRKDAIVCEELDENFINMLLRLKYTNKRDESAEVKVSRNMSYESMTEDLLRRSGRRTNVMSIVSRYVRNNKRLLKVLRKKTREENGEPNCCKYEKSNNKCWKHFLNRVETIHDMDYKNSKVFKSFDSEKYKITHIKLHWI